MDVWSRKIVDAQVFTEESMEHSWRLFVKACFAHNALPEGLVLHSDNGGPMKGATMLATLDKLGVTASFSRPSVSNDNPYSESLFRTMKYRPEYPSQPLKVLTRHNPGSMNLSSGTTLGTFTVRFVLLRLMIAITAARNKSWPTATKCMQTPGADIRAGGLVEHEIGIRCPRSG